MVKSLSLREAFLRYKCIIFYFYDTKNLNFDIVGLDFVPSVLEFNKKQETFKLNKTNMSYHGKPVFFLLRGYPRNIEFELSDDKRRQDLMELKDEKAKEKIVQEILKETNSKIKIIEKLPSTFEIFSDVNSVYSNRAFNKQRFELRHILAFVLCLALACIITWMVCMIIYTAEITRLKEILIREGIEFKLIKGIGVLLSVLNQKII